MEQKFVTLGVFKDLVGSGGIGEVVAQKNDSEKYMLFGISTNKETVFLVKTSRGINHLKEWDGLGYLGDFIESTGISEFKVIGLLKKE